MRARSAWSRASAPVSLRAIATMLRKYGAGRKKDEVHQHFEYDYREVPGDCATAASASASAAQLCGGCAVNKKLKFFLNKKLKFFLE